MSADERILRLENAMATLAEFSAGHEQRITLLEAGLTRLEEGFTRLTEGFRSLTQVSVGQQRRTARLEESFVTLVQLTRRHHDGADELRAAQAETERRAAETERRAAETERRAAESERRIAALADAQAHSDRRLDALIDIVRNGRNGESQT